MSKKSEPTSPLKIIPLGGLGEIGMNCMILEFQDEILVIDCGLLFSDLDQFGVEFVIPDFTYLKERKDKVKAFIVTHGHEDHIGAIPFAVKDGIHAPVYASPFATELVKARMSENGTLDKVEIRTFTSGDTIHFKHFKIRTVSVNHSIVESNALIIETPVGKVIHTGDFKIDATPFYGEMIKLDIFKKAGDEGVLLLMSDSTNVERLEESFSEKIVAENFEKIFKSVTGLTVVSMFASNVSRMGQIFELADKMGKKIALAGRSMEQNVQLARQIGYLKKASSVLIGMEQIEQYDRNQVIVLATGSQGEFRSALTRMSVGEHRFIQLQKGDTVLLSSKFIPGNERAIGRSINNLFKQGADVLYAALHEIHVSGHATQPELKKMLELVRPKYFLPIHGEYRHLVHHARLAEETGVRVENVVIAVSGDVLELAPDHFKVTEHIEENRVLVEGRDGNDISRLIIKERRQLGETGVVFSLMVRNVESQKVIAGPDIMTKGLSGVDDNPDLIEKAKEHVKKVVRRYEQELASGEADMDLQETIRVELRRFFNERIGKKPVVLPIVLDL